MRIHLQNSDGVVAGGAALAVDVAGGAGTGVAPPASLSYHHMLVHTIVRLSPGMTIINIFCAQCGDEKT